MTDDKENPGLSQEDIRRLENIDRNTIAILKILNDVGGDNGK